ncbi:MAG: hypothetical protein ABJM58_08690 [Alteripontixanthobacter sp.]
MISLFDVKFGHYVGYVQDERVHSRWGFSFPVEGGAIIGTDETVWGSFSEGRLYNRDGDLMANAEAAQ